jgi:hypothetical protein
MTDATLTEPVRPRRVRRRLIVAVILLLPLATHAVWDQIESTLLVRDIAAIARRGEPVNLGSRRAALSDPELRRSAALYAAAADLARWQSKGFAFENKDIEDHSTDALFEASTLSAYLAESEPALQLLNSATPLRFTEFANIAPGLYANQSPLETLNAMNCLSADVLSARGEGDVAADALVRSIRLQRTLPSPFYRNFALRRLYGSFRILVTHSQPEASLSGVCRLRWRSYRTRTGCSTRSCRAGRRCSASSGPILRSADRGRSGRRSRVAGRSREHLAS